MQNLSYQSIGGYVLGNLVAAGTYATLYELPDPKDPKTSRKLVAKVFPASLDEDASYRRRFDDTLQRIGQLAHNHLMPIYDYGIDTGTGLSYIIMPYFESQTLAERISVKGAISRREAMIILRQLAQALDDLHIQGFVHRDVKPSNIFFDDENMLLADLGIAGILQETFDLLGIQQQVGLPAFFAPELWQKHVPTPASDIYALGILAYQLLVGKLPFEASMLGAVEYQHLNEMPIPPSKLQSDLPTEVDVIVERVLAKQPTNRFQTATAFVQTLSVVIGDFLDVETTIQPALSVDRLTSSPLLASSVPQTEDHVLVDQSDEAELTETVIPVGRSPILKWGRRVGCLSMLAVWMVLMLSPCLLLTVIVRGEATLSLSDKPGHQLRMFKVFEEDVRGFGFSWGSVEQSDDGESVCIKTHVRYITWQGSGDNVEFCQCYTQVGEEWIAGIPVDAMCNPSQN